MRRHLGATVGLAGWLLIGQRWGGVKAWEELTGRREPYRDQAACERELAAHRRKAKGETATRLWTGARCVTDKEFQHLPKSVSRDEPWM
jgi:hypothetical protein